VSTTRRPPGASAWAPARKPPARDSSSSFTAARTAANTRVTLARVLRAVDELTGLIVAIALVKGRDLDQVEVDSVLKKWKDKRFAAGVNRAEIEQGAQEIGLSLEKHIAITLKGMKAIKTALGL